MKKVLIVGVFNVLHPGHVRLLRFARECGDYLVVAVQTGNIVEDSAHVNEMMRLEAVQCNTYVNEAFITEESIGQLIEEVRPDVLVKGKEHENEDNTEEERLLALYGGELIFDSGDAFHLSSDILRKELEITQIYEGWIPESFMGRHGISRKDLLTYLDKFSGLSVAVIGELIIDEYIVCDPLGMSQEDPTIVVTPIDKKYFLGGAGIVAGHAASMGANVKFISVVGKDDISKVAQTFLNKYGVESSLFVDAHRPTILKQRFRSKGKTLLRVNHFHQVDISSRLQKEIIREIEKIANEVDLLVFSDFNYGCLPQDMVNKIINIGRENDICMVVDSQSSSQVGDVSRYKNVDMVISTEHEARLAVRDNSNGLVVLADKLLAKTNTKETIVKLAEEGILIHSSYNERGEVMTDKISALNKSPKDVSGAGDSMLIAAAMTLSVKGTVWEAALIGSIASALQIKQIGNCPLIKSEVKKVIGQ